MRRQQGQLLRLCLQILLSGFFTVLCFPYQCTNEPPHDKTNKVACAPSKVSDQPGHLPSRIRVFAVRMKNAWVLATH